MLSLPTSTPSGALSLLSAALLIAACGGSRSEAEPAASGSARATAGIRAETNVQVTARADVRGVYRVGPGQRFTTLQQVAPVLRPGDTVEVIDDQVGDIVLSASGTPNSKITIRGVRHRGRRPVLLGGKTTLEIAGNHVVVEGFEITGGTSRCLFHHAHDVTVRDVVIHDCPSHGLLGADSGAGSLTLEYSEVYRCGEGERRHQIYMATDESAYRGAVFRMQHCYVHDALGGHNVKSRAERNEIFYNWIEGAYHHELELIGPDGQAEELAREDADVVGNVLYQGYWERSHPVIRIGGDGTGQTWGRYRFANNTIVLGQASTSAVFRIFHGVESVEMHNNVLFRVGGAPVTVIRDAEAQWTNGRAISGSNNWVTSGSTEVPEEWQNTLSGSDPQLRDGERRDVRPTMTSPLCGAVTTTASAQSALAAQLMPPLHTLPAPGNTKGRERAHVRDVGAFVCRTR
jgi:hypothetical protein